MGVRSMTRTIQRRHCLLACKRKALATKAIGLGCKTGRITKEPKRGLHSLHLLRRILTTNVAPKSAAYGLHSKCLSPKPSAVSTMVDAPCSPTEECKENTARVKSNAATELRTEAETKRGLRPLNHRLRESVQSPHPKSQSAHCNTRKSPIMYNDLADFQIQKYISQGSFGKVHKAMNKKTNQIVALKSVEIDQNPDEIDYDLMLPIAIAREMKMQWACLHPNIVQLFSVVQSRYSRTNGTIYLVMELMMDDMAQVLEKKTQPFTPVVVKHLMYDLLNGVSFLHKNGFIHRDLKPENLLVDADYNLKISDLGLARPEFNEKIPHESPLTPKVGTRNYVAPEIFLDMDSYDVRSDMWAVGCIMAEFLTGQMLFECHSDIHQIKKIFSILGPACTRSWPEFTNSPWTTSLSFLSFPTIENPCIKKILEGQYGDDMTKVSDCGYELIEKCLVYNPRERISSEEAVRHPWFTESPTLHGN